MATMWIVAGPNGAGKSTLTNQILKELNVTTITKLNADEVTVALRAHDPDGDQADLNLQAAKIVDQQVLDCIDQGADFLVETVLSSPKYRDAVSKAHENGFLVSLIYVSLYPAQLSPERVSERVRKGGHNVDRQKAIDRYFRSHEQLVWFAQAVDELMIIDNSSANGEPTWLAIKAADGVVSRFIVGKNLAVDQALDAAFGPPQS
jgi:predicted ABC-type ATPase